MSKAVLLSIKPKYCGLIASGKKTIEVRKSRPKLATPFKCYIYCTVGGIKKMPRNYLTEHFERGKVIGEFVCDKIDRIAHCGTCNNDIRLRVVDEKLCYKELDYAYLDNCKLSYTDIDRYSNGCDVYGWHISDLVIYDEPKLLHRFFKPCDGCDKIGTKRCTEELTDCRAKVITRPPQSWSYVESEVPEDDR